MKGWFRWAVFLLCALTLGLVTSQPTIEKARESLAHLEQSPWKAANVWLRSTECALETGAWLVICAEDGRLEPISQHALADDPGHAFFLTVKASLSGKPQGLIDIVKVNMRINYVALVLLCLLLLNAGSGLQSFLLLFMAAPVYLGGTDPSPHPGILGAVTLASLLPLSLLLRAHLMTEGWRFAVAVVSGVLALACAALLREPVGTMGLLMTVAALLYLAWRQGPSRHWPVMVCVAVSATLAWKSSLLLLSYRDHVQEVAVSEVVATHGTSHSLFIGLGAVENRWGIEWNDDYAAQAAARVKPAVVYVSREYFDILRGLYLDKLRDDPLEVLRIYVLKAGNLVQQAFPEKFLPLYLVALLLAVDAVLMIRRRREWSDADRVHLMASVLSMGFVGLFVLQGMLAHPKRLYSEPISAFVLLTFATWLARRFTMGR